MFSDTSRTAEGSAYYLVKISTINLLHMQANILPPLAANYSINELNLLQTCVNISKFKHWLAKVDYDCRVDHLTSIYIVKSKTEPPSVRIKNC